MVVFFNGFVMLLSTTNSSSVTDFLFIFSSVESWIERCLNESENKRYPSHTSLGNVSNDESKS